MPMIPLPQVKIEPPLNRIRLTVDFVNPENNTIKADGKLWGVKSVGIAKFEKGKTYDVGYTSKEGTGKWAGRTFYDITDVAINPATQPALNGAAKDQRITELALVKLVQIPFSNRETMANAMTEAWFAARDACDRMLNDDIPY